MSMRSSLFLALVSALTCSVTIAFVPTSRPSPNRQAIASSLQAATLPDRAEAISVQKKKLLGLLKPEPCVDPILADPVTKEPLVISLTSGTTFGGQVGPKKVKYTLQAKPNGPEQTTTAAAVYTGDSLSYINLLEPVDVNEEESRKETSEEETRRNNNQLVRQLAPLVPPPLRAALSATGLVDDEYIPMRDLFTSPAVSYAYERGWRQNFRAAGFPGPDEEAKLAMEYFAPAMRSSTLGTSRRVLVDMSCATGLFTRRFAKSGKYQRVLGCDYSSSMLEEARRRINADPELGNRRGNQPNVSTQLDLIRLDVGQIPMQTNSIDALHAGAAMHCWPDLPAAVKEIYRVLRPGGRYFATTFLSSWFGTLSSMPGAATNNNTPSQQAFQYFKSVDVLRDLLIQEGGFEPSKVYIEVLGNSCVVIRAEK